MKRFVNVFAVLVTLCLMSVSIAGCSTISTDAWVRPINPTKADMACMSRSIKEQIVVHNETWESKQ